jgi:hypothetical protein
MASQILGRINIIEPCGYARPRHEHRDFDVDASDPGRDAEMNRLGALGRVASAGVHDAGADETVGPRGPEADL